MLVLNFEGNIAGVTGRFIPAKWGFFMGDATKKA